MSLGETIKKMRRSQDMTQEQLAQFLNISAQAVSRWETGLAMPDIMLLPSLANLFGITMDELFGMQELRNKEYLNNVFSLAHQSIADGKYADAITILREALKTFPNNYGLMSDLAIALSFFENNSEEAITLCQRVLENSTSDKLRGTTRANLCFLYKKAGLCQKAVDCGRLLPHFWESREMILPELMDKQGATAHLKKTIPQILALLCEKIDSVEKGEPNLSEMLAVGLCEPAEYDASTVERITAFLE